MLLFALKNMLRNKIRNVLSIIGISAGIGVCIISLSIGKHVLSQVEGIIERYQVDLIVQSSGSALPAQSRISKAEYEAISLLPGVKDASAAVVAILRTHFDNLFLIMGISEPDHFFGRVAILDGEWFEKGKNELVLGHLSSRLNDFQVGNKLVLANSNLMTISGIYSLGYNMMDAAAIMHIDDARKILNSPDAINIMLIKANRETEVHYLMDTIHNKYPHLHASVSTEFADHLGFDNYLEYIAIAISIVSLLTCCLIIMNTLFMAISERIREMGILMAIGWSRVRISLVIMLEGLALSISGWIAGVLMSSIFLWWAQGLRGLGPAFTPGTITLEIVCLSLALTIILALAGSIIPSALSLRLQPAEALRQE